MTLATRLTLILMLLLPFAGEVLAQETTTTDKPAAATSTAATSTVEVTEPATEAGDEVQPERRALTSYEVRNQFSQLLRQYPTELATVLALDPSLLSNETFLAGYPELGRYVAAHPEIPRNPRFYLVEFVPRRQSSFFEEALEGIFIFSIFAFIAFVLAWVVRTIVEQKRWSRLTRTQTEVHNKILDRFSSSEELLAYIRTPAGTKFLESAPIPLHTEPVTQAPSTPVTRILRSIQVGTVVAIGALGMILVSFRFEEEAAQDLFGMGAIAFAVGVGFIVSAVVSLMLSRRLGLWEDKGAASAQTFDEAGPVR